MILLKKMTINQKMRLKASTAMQKHLYLVELHLTAKETQNSCKAFLKNKHKKNKVTLDFQVYSRLVGKEMLFIVVALTIVLNLTQVRSKILEAPKISINQFLSMR